MNRINLNKLYYFFIVAKEGSIKAASKKLNLTQPTISTQIHQLEDDLGFQLFDRKHRKLNITTKGRLILKKADKIFELTDELNSTIPTISKNKRTKFRVGAIQSLSNSFIFDFSLKLWRDSSVSVSVTQGSFADLKEKMDNDKIDIILTDGPYKNKTKYKSVSLGRAKVVAVGNNSIRIKKSDFPLALTSHNYLAFSNQGRLQDDIEYFFHRKKIAPEVIGSVDDVTLMKVITEKSNCFCILPYKAVKESIQQKKVKLLGEIKEIQAGLWAVIPSHSANNVFIKKLLKDYFIRKK